MNEFSWVGSEKDFVDERDVRWVNRMAVGRFGGNSSAGQSKNEDGCIVWQAKDWEFAAILDAHKSAASAELVIRTIDYHKETLLQILSLEGHPDFIQLERKLLEIFQSKAFLDACKEVTGETACLIAMNQFQLNQRQFYE